MIDSTDSQSASSYRHARSEIEVMLLQIRGLVFARALLEERGASEAELAEYRLETERLRRRLARLVAESHDRYGSAA